MARKLKLLEIEEVRHNKTNQKATIYYDRNRNCFCATVAETEYTAETKDKLKGQVYTALGNFSGWTWEVKILIHHEKRAPTRYGHRGEYRHDASVDFSFWRMEMAKKPDGSVVERPFLNGNSLTDSEQRDIESRALSAKQKEEWIEGRAHINRTSRNSGQDLHEFYNPYGSAKVLGFKPELWDALHAIKARIDLARIQLTELVKSDDLEQKLLQVAMARPLSEGERKLLAAPHPEDEDD
jgi:hypothetical protein